MLVVTLLVQAAAGHSMSGRGLSSAGVQLGVIWLLVLSCRRWPRTAGALLIAVVAWIVWNVRTLPAAFGLPGVVMVASLLCLPFVVPAVALLAPAREGGGRLTRDRRAPLASERPTRPPGQVGRAAHG